MDPAGAGLLGTGSSGTPGTACGRRNGTCPCSPSSRRTSTKNTWMFSGWARYHFTANTLNKTTMWIQFVCLFSTNKVDDSQVLWLVTWLTCKNQSLITYPGFSRGKPGFNHRPLSALLSWVKPLRRGKCDGGWIFLLSFPLRWRVLQTEVWGYFIYVVDKSIERWI